MYLALSHSSRKERLKAAEGALHQSEAYYRSLFENSLNAIFLTAPDGSIDAANPAACQILGMTAEALCGCRFQNLVDGAEDRKPSTLAELNQKQNPLIELTFLRKDGGRVPVEVTSVLLNNGAKAFFIAQDITERKKWENAIRNAKEHLEVRVQERTQELTLAMQALQERSRQLQMLTSELTMTEERMRQHLAHVLHDDLQQILVSARLRLELMAVALQPEFHQASGEVIDMLQQSIQISRSLTAELSPPILHTGGLQPALCWLVRWVLEKQNLTVTLDCGALEPMADDLKIFLFQATRELLLNIVKHAGVQEAGIAVVQREGLIELTISDKGAGFDPQLLLSAEKCDGFGLLSIRERLELLGGSFMIDSAPGLGCRVTLVAPLRTGADTNASERSATDPSPAIAAASPADEEVPPAGRIRVLIADDNLMLRREFSRVLSQYRDIEVVGDAPDGEVATRLARELQPDVILMDLSMPRMDGLEATRTIHAEWPDIRIIGLSMYEEPEHADAMRAAGAVNYLIKGCPPRELADAIRDSMPMPAPAPRRQQVS